MTELKLNLDGISTTVVTDDEGICAYDLLSLFIGQMRAQTFSETNINRALLSYVDEYVKEDKDGK